MLFREIIPRLSEALGRQAAVVLLGPRQVGKTTSALALRERQPSIYLDLEDPEDLVKLEDPVAYLEHYADRLVILDELHRVPELFAPLRSLIDRGRRQGRRTGRFLLLGSASMKLMRQSSETLAGRITFLEMTPLNIMEAGTTNEEITRLWLRGGYPESYLADNGETSFLHRRDLIQTYLHRDVAAFLPSAHTELVERLWQMLAHLHGTIYHTQKLSASLGMSTWHVNQYTSLLIDLFLVRRLAPYQANLKKRLVKSPKLYLRDSGILHALLRIRTMDELFGHPIAGPSWEGFVIENLLSATGDRADAGFYRTSGGAEIDLLLDWGLGERWAVEIKRSAAAKTERGFYDACADLQPAKAFVVYPGTERFPLRAGAEAISLAELRREIVNRA